MRSPPSAPALVALPLVAVLALVAACGEGPKPTVDTTEDTPSDRLVEGEGETLVYSMRNRWGEVPQMVAQLHLAEVLRERLAAMGSPDAGVEVGKAGELRVTVPEEIADEAAAAVEQSVSVRFRIRAPSEIENPEREKRAEMGEFYAETLPDFAWFSLPNRQDVLLYVPEAKRIAEIEELRRADAPDEALIREKTEALQQVLLQRVFTEADLSDAQAIHRPGDSSVRLTIRPERREAFREFTAHYRTRQMAVLLNGRVIAAPTLSEPLSEAAEIRKPEGALSQPEADGLAAAIRRSAYGIELERTK